MQVGTGKSVLNGIAIGKLKIYKKKDTAISTAPVADTAAELERFEAARQKAIEQQTALYEKALAEAGEDIAEVFNIHAMMLDDDDFVDAIKEIINGQKMCAEYAVKTAGNNQAAVFSAMDDPYLQARSADVLDIAQAMLDILQGVDNASLQGTEPSILVAEDLAPSETVRMDKSLLLGFITREGSSNSHTAILARSMNIPALIQCKDIQDDWDGKMAVVDGYNACVYVDPTPDLLESLKKRQQEDQKKQALLQELKGKPNTTLDGKTVQVFANIGGMSDVGAVQQNDAGGVGLFACQWAKALGVQLIGTVSSPEKARLARQHGAWETIDYSHENVARRVLELTDGKKCPVVYDSVGKDTWETSLDCVAPRGLLVSFGNASGPVTGVNLGILSQKGSLYVTRPTLGSYADTPEKLQAMADELFGLIERGDIRIEINQRFALAEAARAHTELAARRTTGSTVLLP